MPDESTPEGKRSDRRLLVFAKYPRAGEVKTRLVPPLTYDEAERLFRAFLLDATHSYTTLGQGVEPVIYVGDGRDIELMRVLAHEGVDKEGELDIRPQRGRDLGERMENAIAEAFAERCRSVCVIGTDHPTLPLEFIRKGFDSLQTNDLVLGPADDGGYYLLGMNKLHPEIFRGMPWSTGSLFQETVRTAGQYGLRTSLLPEWYDVDDASGLERLVHQRETLGASSRTAEALRVLERENEVVRTMRRDAGIDDTNDVVKA